MALIEPVEESLVPFQRASLDPLMDPLPVLIAATADTAIIEGVMVEDDEEIAADELALSSAPARM